MQVERFIPIQAEPVFCATRDQTLSFREARECFERAYFIHLLQKTDGNISSAARLSGIARQHFYAHIKRLAIVT